MHALARRRTVWLTVAFADAGVRAMADEVSEREAERASVAGADSEVVDFRILGPLEVARGDRLLELPGRKQRALLALLLIEPGHVFAADRLIEELWHEQPPPGAEKTLRSYVSRLRAALAFDALVATRSGGYALEVDAGRIDAQRFQGLLAGGEEALARAAPDVAAERLRAALSLWRGRALSGLAAGGLLALEARRLQELRLAALEQRIDADLALGLHGQLVAELEQLVAEHPLRERLWRQLLLALYRS